ncbi:MAG: hypothetical protein KDA22_08065 [Phycisphaerales bacterium]|nr:hypothetical protein [Phycisphaerales bacterium]
MIRRAETAVLVLALGAAVLGGCYTPAGGIMPSSTGAVTYYSTETEQKTITMIDLRTDQPFFVQVIPPSHQLTFQYLQGGGDDPVLTPDRMIYAVLPMGTMTGKLTNQITVPPASARRIDVSVSQDIKYAPEPPEQRLRTDQVEDRPDYWSPRGGPLPEKKNPYDG